MWTRRSGLDLCSFALTPHTANISICDRGSLPNTFFRVTNMTMTCATNESWEPVLLNFTHGKILYEVFVVIGELSGFASILGSALIIYLILRERKWGESFFERLMLGLSVADFISTTGIVGQPFMVPSCTDLPFSRGNLQTCQATGFLFVFLFASCMYSCTLAIYFLTSTTAACRRWGSGRGFVFCEAAIHCCLWTFCLLHAVLAVVFKQFEPSPFTLVCSVMLPGSGVLNRAIYVVPFLVLVLSCLTGLLCILVLYLRLRSLRAISSYGSDSSGPSSSERRVTAALYVLSSLPSDPMTSETCSTISLATTTLQMAVIPPRFSLGNEPLPELEDIASQNVVDADEDDEESGISRTRIVVTNNRNTFLTQQALCYSLGFLNTIVPFIIAEMVWLWTRRREEEKSPSVMVPFSLSLLYLFVPLQGFVNCFVYLRPRFIRWRDFHEEQSWLWVGKQILACNPMPPPNSRTAHLVRQRNDGTLTRVDET